MNPKTAKKMAAIIALVLAVLLIVPIVISIVASGASTASTLNGKLNTLEKEMKQIKTELAKIEKQKKSAMTQKEVIDRQLNVTHQEIDTINQLISALDKDISDCNTQLAEAEKREAEQYEVFRKRVRAMEEQGTVSMLGIVLAADDFSDLLTRAELVGEIAQYDNALIEQIEKLRLDISTSKTELEANKAAQVSAKAKLNEKNASLKTQYSKASELVSELQNESSEYKKAYEEAENAQAATKKELKKLLAASTSTGKSTKYVGGTFLWPVPTCTLITSKYGYRFDPIFKKQKKHTGVDIGASYGSKIVAANSGTVITAGWSSRGYGNYVIINHGGGTSTLYGHMSSIAVKKGASIKKGDTVGYVGSTGYSTGPHLHFEVLINGDDVNPMNYFKKA